MAKKKKYRLKPGVKKLLILIGIIILVILILPKNKTKSAIDNVFKDVVYTKEEFYKVDKIYIPLNGKIDLSQYKYKLEDDILVEDNNILIGNKVGNTKIKITKDNKYDELEIIVTDIISNYQINNKKYLTCDKYSKEDEVLLEDILENQVELYGYKTRAGVVQAARFLSLEFKEKLKYFYENGRMSGKMDFCDGEGRYLHKGLYLSKDDYKDLKQSRQGPAIWGCPMYEETRKTNIANGLDCSGFVTWAMFNAGYDIPDYGAADLFKLGTKKEFTNDDVWKEIKVGDLVGRNGHVGILIGLKDDKYYIAEALDYDLHILVYTKEDLMKSELKFFVLMDDYYKEDGVLNNYWN